MQVYGLFAPAFAPATAQRYARVSQNMREVIATLALPSPRFRYTPVIRAGSLVFVSGLIGLNPAQGGLADGPYAQTHQVMKNLFDLCDEQGWAREQILMARVYCSGPDAASEFNRAWDEVFESIVPPARSVATVLSLPLGAAIEIEFQLAL
ncbi:MAG: RidA family protein [Burkholderiaceae bacterium]